MGHETASDLKLTKDDLEALFDGLVMRETKLILRRCAAGPAEQAQISRKLAESRALADRLIAATVLSQ